MSLISIRLSDEIERSLSQEAQRARRPKSEIVREAIVDYLKHRERERYLASLESAARVLAQDTPSRQEALDIAEDFLPLEEEAWAVAEPRAEYKVARSARAKKSKGKK